MILSLRGYRRDTFVDSFVNLIGIITDDLK